MLEIGDKAPIFSLPDQNKEKVSLEDFKGKWIVLYFYPKDNTSGWTKEAVDFTERLEAFNERNAVIIGISPDSPDKHKNFMEKYNLKIILLCDENKEVMKKYNVYRLKKMYGKESMGVVRTTFLINPECNISYVWNNVKVRQKRKKNGETYEIIHAEQVLEKLKQSNWKIKFTWKKLEFMIK